MKKSLINITIASCLVLGASMANADSMTGVSVSGISNNSADSLGIAGGRGGQVGLSGQVQPGNVDQIIQNGSPEDYRRSHVSNQTNIVGSGLNGPFGQLGNPGNARGEFSGK
jgi:hypothetical protein